MIFKAEECGNYWCPLARVLSDGAPINRETEYLGVGLGWGPKMRFSMMCVGPKCGGWRWHGNMKVYGFCGFAGPIVGTEPNENS